MPQIMVDTDTESPVSLRMLADLLTSYATLKETEEVAGARTVSALAAATHQHTAQETGRTTGMLPELGAPFTPDLPQGDETTQAFNPAEIFAKAGLVPPGTAVPVAPTGPTLPGNVLPFPGAPSFPPVNLAPTAGQTQTTLPLASSAGAASTVASVELDSAGIPWDARIHQDSKGRNDKGKGTWKVKKGLETKSPGLLEQVMAELTANKLNGVTGALAAAAAVAPPVTLPPGPLSMPQPAVGPAGGPLVLPTMPLAPPGGALPPVSSGLPPANLPAPNVGVPANPMTLFQALMQKIGAALNATPPQITQEQVNAAHINLGVPQLQLLITQPDKIPQVEAALGL
jgi:hypothetical protein